MRSAQAGCEHLRLPRILRSGAFMLLDDMTRRNLELVESIRPGEGGTLLEVLDETVTAMGGRLLRKWVLRPLVEISEIWETAEAVEELFGRGSASGGSSRENFKGHHRPGAVGREGRDGKGGSEGSSGLGPVPLPPPHRSRTLASDAGVTPSRSLLAEMDPLTDLLALLEAGISPDAPRHPAGRGV